MFDCEEGLVVVEPIRSLSEMEPSGVSVQVTESRTNKDHCQSVVSKRHSALPVGWHQSQDLSAEW